MVRSEWENIRREIKGLPLADIPFSVLGAADNSPVKWFASDKTTTPNEYLRNDYDSLIAMRGMGRVRLNKIHKILTFHIGENLPDTVEEI